MDHRDGVDPGHHPLHVEDDRDRHAGRDVGAEVLDGVHAQAGDAAILIERELASEPMVARLSVGDEALGSARGPLDRAPETASRPGERDVLGIGLDLRAKAAADVTGDAAHAIARHAEDAREVGRELMHALQRGVDRVASGGGVPGGEGRARLHEAGDQAVVDQREPGDVGRAGKRALGCGGVAALPVVDAIARGDGVKLRGAVAERRDGVDDRRPRGVAHHDRFGAVARLGRRRGDDHRDRLAHVAHAVGGQCQPRRLGEGRAVTAPDVAATLGDQRRDPTDTVGGEIVPGEHGEHAGDRLRGRRIDGEHVGVGVR